MSNDSFERIRQAAPDHWKVTDMQVSRDRIRATCETRDGRKVLRAHVEGETVEQVIQAVQLLLLSSAMLRMPDRVDIDLHLDYDRQGEDTERDIRELASTMGIELPSEFETGSPIGSTEAR